MTIFQTTVLRKYIKAHEENFEALIQSRYTAYIEYFHNPDIQENIRTCKEEQFQEGFVREFFVRVLGYTINPNPNYNIKTEQKNEQDSQKADGAIIIDGDVRAVIELKDHKTPNLKKIEGQAFGYKTSHKNCPYVITSNFEKLRFYIDNKTEHEEFNLFTLSRDEFLRLHLLLSYESISENLPLRIKGDSTNHEEEITNQLYKDYSLFKRELFADIVEQNTDYDKLTLFKKSQKLLDRLLFIFFAEDKGLLPPNSMQRTISKWEMIQDDELSADQKLYDRFKLYFNLMNIGSVKGNIFAYNGGLFAPDEVLDGIVISDEVLRVNVLKLANYDFATEVDVNILGHIFENSLTEIEEVTAEITTGERPTSKRKKDGVFYTPRYITTYIVENTVGRLCSDKKAELDIRDEEYYADKKRNITTKKPLYDKLQAYRKWLLSITICDPACGSGAFLNAALDFLISEHRNIDEMTAKLTGDAMVLTNIETSILENNLFGVDINDESVEIARLSLWLRTAKPQRKLNSLSNNIKCGNSLISDPEVAGDKAFCWETEFSQVFANGGFDVVVGNPPYFNIQTLGIGSLQVKSIQETYKVIWQDKSDILFYFIYKALQISKSEVGYIVSNAFLFSDKAQKLRNFILDDGRLSKIVNFEQYMVFDDASITSGIFIFNKNTSKKDTIEAILIKDKNYSIDAISNAINDYSKSISVSLKYNDVFALVDDTIDKLNIKIDSKHKALGDICKMGKGMETAADPIFLYDKYPHHMPSEYIKKRVTGKNISKYNILADSDYILYFEDAINFSSLPEVVQEYLENNRTILENRATVKNEGRVWWRYSRPMHKEFYNLPKLYCSRRAFNNTFCFDSGFEYLGFSNMTVIFETNIDYAIKYILALLNSTLLNFRYKSIGKQTGGGSFEYFPNGVSKLPIPEIGLEEQQPFIELADKMLDLNKTLADKRKRFLRRLTTNFEGIKITGALEHFDESEFKDFVAALKKQKIKLSLTDQDEWEEYFISNKTECNTLSAQIATTDDQIDQMVYALYGLTDDEIAIIENR